MQKNSRLLIALCAVVMTAWFLASSAAANPIVIKAKGIKLVAHSAKNIELFYSAPSGNQEIVKLTGYHVKWKPDARTETGVIKKIEVDGHAGIEITYKLNHDLNGQLRVRGRYILSPRHLHIRFDVWGVPKKNHLGGSMIGRMIGKGASGRKLFKVGRWVYDDRGGVPYEVRDGKLFKYQWKDVSAWFAFPKHTTPKWRDQWNMHCPLSQVKEGHWKSACDIFLTDSSWRPRAVAALWHKRPVGLSIWTNKAYNWWTSNKKPLKVHVQIVNTSVHAQRVPLHYWARNYQGDFVAKGRQSFYMKPGQVINKTLAIQASKSRTILFLKVDVGKGKAFARTTLSVLPPHQFKSTPKTSIFGLAASWPQPNLPKSMRQKAFYQLLQRMGVRWLRAANGKEVAKYGMKANRHTSVHPYDKYKGKPKAREAWIRKQLKLCVKHDNPYWEFANEWNGAGGWGSGSPKAAKVYVKYLKEIHRIKKQMGVDVKILSMGLAGMDVKFMRNVYNDGGWPLFDAFALHTGRGNFVVDYPVKTPWDKWKFGPHGSYWNFFGSVLEANNMLKKYGDKPLWITEAYALTYPNHWWNDTQRQAAQNVILTYALGAAEGVRCIEFFQLNNGRWFNHGGINAKNREYSFGLLFRKGNFKPSLMAYCAIAENLDQAKFAGWLHFKNKLNKGLLFNTPRGALAILWNRADGYIEHKKKGYVETEPWVKTWKTQTPIELPAADNTVRVLNSIGQQTTVQAEDGQVHLVLTGAPKMVYGLATKKISK